MALQLFVNTQASDVGSALVRSLTDMSPVGLPILVVGDRRDYELYLVDGAGGYASFSGNGAYIPYIAIGNCGYPNGGTLTLTFSGQTTSALAWNASPTQWQTALQALSSVGSGNCTVTGAAGQYYVVTFTGALGGVTQPEITCDFSLLTPDSTVDVSAIIAGGSGVNCVQLLNLAVNPISFASDWTPITNGWSGKLSTRTLQVIERFAAAGGSLNETFQITVADPSGDRRTYVKVGATIQCTIINPESFAGSDKPLLATQAQLSAAVLGLNNFTWESLSSSSAGNTNVTRASTSRHHVARVSISGSASTRTVSILTTNSPNAGDSIFVVLLPDSTAGNIVEVRNATSTGTLLKSITTDGSATPYFLFLAWSGSVWQVAFTDASLLSKTGNLAGLSSTITAKSNLKTLFSGVSDKTASFTASTADDGTLFRCSTATGAIVVTLPNAGTAGAGFLIPIQKSDSSTQTVTTSPPTATLTSIGQMAVLMSDGSSWGIIQSYDPSSTQPTLSQIVQNRFDLTAIGTGTATSLDSVPTAGGAQPAYAVVMLSFGTPRASQIWQLVPGTDATATGVQRPLDFDSATNAQVWKQIG